VAVRSYIWESTLRPLNPDILLSSLMVHHDADWSGFFIPVVILEQPTSQIKRLPISCRSALL